MQQILYVGTPRIIFITVETEIQLQELCRLLEFPRVVYVFHCNANGIVYWHCCNLSFIFNLCLSWNKQWSVNLWIGTYTRPVSKSSQLLCIHYLTMWQYKLFSDLLSHMQNLFHSYNGAQQSTTWIGITFHMVIVNKLVWGIN